LHQRHTRRVTTFTKCRQELIVERITVHIDQCGDVTPMGTAYRDVRAIGAHASNRKRVRRPTGAGVTCVNVSEP
jgi:hypothetical protein